MADYTRLQNFTVKDALSSGDPEKVILGSDLDGEFNAAATAIATKVNHAGGTITGALVGTDNNLSTMNFIDVSEEYAYLGGTLSGTVDCDFTVAHVRRGIVIGDTEFTFSNPPPVAKSGSFTLILAHSGAHTITWPTSVEWPGGTAPTLTVSGWDVLTFFTWNGGTIWYGFVAGIDMG